MVNIKLIPTNYYVYVAVFISHIGAFIAALSMTWPSPILPKLSTLDDNPLGRILTIDEQSILGSIPIIGTFSTFWVGQLANKYGRKALMIMSNIPALIAYSLMVSANNIWQLYIARVLTGINMAGVFTVNTMYIAEVAENSNRGLLGSFMSSFINLGLLFVLVLGPLTPFFWFHVVLSSFPLCLMILTFVFVPESPHYLVPKNLEKAKISLSKLRGKYDVTEELDDIKQSLEKEINISLKDALGNKGLRKGLIIGCGLILFQQLSGTAAIMSYGQFIFEEAGDAIPSELGPIIIAFIQLIIGCATPLFIDKTGRKTLLLISHIGMTLSHLIFGIYFQAQESLRMFSWLPLLCLIFYIVTYSLGSGPVPWSIVGEIFSSEVKGVATSICITVCNVSAFIILIAFNYMRIQLGIGGTFWVFDGFGVIATFFVEYYVIETKGKSLREIQEILNT